MTSENETVAEIVSKVHTGDYGCAKCDDLCDCPNADEIIKSITNRIEMAHKREVDELQIGIRELLNALQSIYNEECADYGTTEVYNKWRKAMEGVEDDAK